MKQLFYSSLFYFLALTIAQIGVARGASPEDFQLQISILQIPKPVSLSSGKTVLVYELLINNSGRNQPRFVRLSIEDSLGKMIANYTDKTLRAMAKNFSKGMQKSESEAIPVEGGALVLLYLSMDMNEKFPVELVHKLEFFDATSGISAVKYFKFAPNRNPPLVIASPVKGDAWYMDGAIAPDSYHRTATLPYDGQFWAAERYAIDFEIIGKDGRLHHGNMADVKDWHGYAAPIYAASDGIVFSVRDGLNDEVPPIIPNNLPVDQVGGNMVVIAMADGNYAFYAHMIKGRIAVTKGEWVKTGDLLGYVGNSGNSSAPHLHFQISDRQDLLKSYGVPFVIDKFVDRGVAKASEKQYLAGELNWAPNGINTQQQNRLPSLNRVSEFE